MQKEKGNEKDKERFKKVEEKEEGAEVGTKKGEESKGKKYICLQHTDLRYFNQ